MNYRNEQLYTGSTINSRLDHIKPSCHSYSRICDSNAYNNEIIAKKLHSFHKKTTALR